MVGGGSWFSTAPATKPRLRRFTTSGQPLLTDHDPPTSKQPLSTNHHRPTSHTHQLEQRRRSGTRPDVILLDAELVQNREQQIRRALLVVREHDVTVPFERP